MIPFGNVREVRPLNWKASSPISSTPSGIWIEARAKLEEKADDPIDLSVEGKEMDARLEHPLNADSPIRSRCDGRTTVVSDSLSWNADLLISFTPSGMVTVDNPIDLNAPSPISSSDSGSVIDVSPEP